MKRLEDRPIRLRKNVDDFDTAEDMWRRCDTKIPGHFGGWRDRFIADMRDRSNAQIIQNYRGYYAAIETLDDCLGKILGELERTGQLDNSLVVFTSDHGDNLGSHRQIGKQLPFEESISVPFIMRFPQKLKAGTWTDALFAPVDIMPTVLSLADVPCHQVDGKDMSPAAMGKNENLRDAVLIMKFIPLSTNWIINGNGSWRGVRTKRYTYARKSETREPWMLFDNHRDPGQVNNLIDDPAHAELRKKLDEETDRLLAPANDPEDPTVYEELILKERKAHGRSDRREDIMPARVKPGFSFERT